MDSTAARQQLEGELAQITAWANHPIAAMLRESAENEKRKAMTVIINDPVRSIQDFITRERMIGYLDCLERSDALIKETIKEIEQKLTELQEV